ncbi:MAG: hypothetical protein NG712_03120 [Omnitrophica bacterium]|nr:hypothetical protein [Candidatus Omnitrophota bacterium]
MLYAIIIVREIIKTFFSAQRTKVVSLPLTLVPFLSDLSLMPFRRITGILLRSGYSHCGTATPTPLRGRRRLRASTLPCGHLRPVGIYEL